MVKTLHLSPCTGNPRNTRFHHVNPDSKRSQKRKQRLALERNEQPAQILDFVEKKCKKKSHVTLEQQKQLERKLNMSKSKITSYSYQPSWEQLQVEAKRLLDLYVSQHGEVVTLDRQGYNLKSSRVYTPQLNDFLNSAYHNLTLHGNMKESFSPSKVKPEILNLKPVEKINESFMTNKNNDSVVRQIIKK